MCWRGGGDRTWCVDDTHDGQHRTSLRAKRPTVSSSSTTSSTSRAIDGSATSSASDHVIAAVLGTQEGAIAAGHHLVSTGVTWTDHAEAAVLREALVARGIERCAAGFELHAAAALAQAVGRAVGYDKTALMFVERDTATLAVVETADGSVVKVLEPKSAQMRTRSPCVAEMVTEPGRPGTQRPRACSSLAPAWTSPRSRHICRTCVSVPVIAP